MGMLDYVFFRKCDHPFKFIAVRKDSTVEPSEKYPDDFSSVTHHLFCRVCNDELDVGYAHMIGGVDAFLARGRERESDKVIAIEMAKEKSDE